MARTNVETVRRAYEELTRRDDPTRQQTMTELWHEDARWRPLLLGGGTLEGEVYERHEGILRFGTEGADEAWSQLTVEVLELRELDESRVLAHTRLSAAGQGSGVPVGADTWGTWILRDEKIVEGRVFADRAAALAFTGE